MWGVESKAKSPIYLPAILAAGIIVLSGRSPESVEGAKSEASGIGGLWNGNHGFTWGFIFLTRFCQHVAFLGKQPGLHLSLPD
jgi:hypothetical protein